MGNAENPLFTTIRLHDIHNITKRLNFVVIADVSIVVPIIPDAQV